MSYLTWFHSWFCLALSLSLTFSQWSSIADLWWCLVRQSLVMTDHKFYKLRGLEAVKNTETLSCRTFPPSPISSEYGKSLGLFWNQAPTRPPFFASFSLQFWFERRRAGDAMGCGRKNETLKTWFMISKFSSEISPQTSDDYFTSLCFRFHKNWICNRTEDFSPDADFISLKLLRFAVPSFVFKCNRNKKMA